MFCSYRKLETGIQINSPFFPPQVTEELTKDAQQKQESAAIIHAYQLMWLHAAQASALFKVMSKYYKRLLLDKADFQEPFD